MINVHLTKESAYGVFAVLHIARRPEDSSVSQRELTEACGIPPESLPAILPKLVAAGVVRCEEIPPEGFSLLKPPDQITLLEIAEAVDGKQEPDLMLPRQGRPTNGPAPSDRPLEEALQPEWMPIASLAASLLATATIQDLADAESGSPGLGPGKG